MNRYNLLQRPHAARFQLAVMCLALLMARSAWPEPVLIDDFGDDSDDGWTTIDSTVGQPYGPGTFEVSSNSFQLEGGGTIHQGVPGGGFLAAMWEPSSDDKYADGFVRAKIRANTQGSIASLMMRMSGSLESGLDGYLYFGSTAANRGQGGFLINRIINSETDADWFVPLSFAVNEDWILEAGAVGDRITLKAWGVGEPEPDAPQIVIFDSAFDEGTLGVESNIHVFPFGGPAVVSATFDDIYFTFPGPEGDFNNDGDVDSSDLDSLMRHLKDDGSLYFDVTSDMVLDEEDLHHWVTELKNTWIGDANLDGEFNSGDLTAVFQVAKYETDEDAGWAEGDWTGDGRVDTSDLTAAFQDGGYELGPRAAVNAVPELSGCVFLLTLCLLGVGRIRNRRAC